jgi:hypothetical protein
MSRQMSNMMSTLTTLCGNRFLAFIAIAMSVSMSACATTPEPRVVTKTVNVAIPVKCDPQPRPQKPTLPDYDSAPDIFEGVKRLIARDKLHTAYEGELEAALSGCTGN